MDASDVTVTTNNVPRDVIEAYQLSAKERDEFDYIDWPAVDRGEGSASFFRYKGELLDLGEFMVWDGVGHPFPKWDGYRSDSFFSGLLIRYTEDFESVVVGQYCC
jgi:hypothetical protein